MTLNSDPPTCFDGPDAARRRPAARLTILLTKASPARLRFFALRAKVSLSREGATRSDLAGRSHCGRACRGMTSVCGAELVVVAFRSEWGT